MVDIVQHTFCRRHVATTSIVERIGWNKKINATIANEVTWKLPQVEAG